MTFWEFAACVDGWNRAQAGSHHYNGTMTDEEYDALCALGDRWSNGGSNSRS